MEVELFTVKESRVESAQKIFVDAAKALDEETVMNVLTEIGLDSAAYYDDRGKLAFSLSDLQLVSAAAAMATVRESSAMVKAIEV